MMNSVSNELNREKCLPVHLFNAAVFVLILITLYIVSRYNYLLFHSSIELFSVIISCSVFVLSTFTYHKEKNAFSILGIGYLVVGILDFFHLLTFQGMNIFTGNIYYTNQLWVCARLIEAASILFFLVYIKRQVHHFLSILVVYLLILVIVSVAIFYFSNVYPFFFQGQLKTVFKVCAEYITCLLLGIALILVKSKDFIKNIQIRSLFLTSILVILLSEFCFTFNTDNYRFLHIAGHLLKVISLYLIYKSILLVNVRDPLDLIFKELNKKIAETRLLNEQLSESEKKQRNISKELEQIIDNIPGLVFYKDKDNRYIKVNQYLANAHHKKKEELEGKSLFSLYAGKDAEDYYKDDLLVISTGKAKLNIEERWETESGVKWINVNKIPFIDENGKILGVIGMAMDITDKKKYEQKILKLLTELETEKNAALKTSLTDGLTEIYNRRYFNEILQKQIAFAKRENRLLSIAMIDIDYFKDFNDLYGHLAGDDCLKRVAAALNSTLYRTADTLARYGGEEFIVVLENTDQKGALLLAEKMRQTVFDLHIEHAKSACERFITISIGVTTITEFPSQEPYSLVKFADKALYRAKNGGRNRVEFCSPEQCGPIRK